MLPEQIDLKIFGKTCIIVVDGTKFSANLELPEKDKLKTYIASFNKKPSEVWFNKVKSVFKAKEKPASKERIARKQAVKKVKETKLLEKSDRERIKILEETVAQLQAQLSSKDEVKAIANIATVSETIAPQAVVGTKKSGEH